jgi:DNA modification methylase
MLRPSNFKSIKTMGKDLFGNTIIEDILLRDKFVEPPFSVLDTKSGNWQRRKKLWKKIGMKSEVGRDATTFNMKDWTEKKRAQGLKGNKVPSDTSIFDPALCEVLYHWFVPKGGTILDPFAGGSVRGIVANKLGFKYTGIDIRDEQVKSNREQAIDILGPQNLPKWLIGDSNKVLDSFSGDITPVHRDSKGMYFKREDYAGFTTMDKSSGTKVRAYNHMILNQPDAEYLVVGCSADSLMQVYVSEMAVKHGKKSKVFIPGRKDNSKMTQYCMDLGADITELKSPCYPNHYRKAVKDFSVDNNVVKWQPAISALDSKKQVSNIPKDVKRIVIPTGSGAIAIGIICGLIETGRHDIDVVLVKVSKAFGGKKEIVESVKRHFASLDVYIPMPNIDVIDPTMDYKKEVNYTLEDGTELDPVYSAKAYKWMLENPKENTLLWISGRRPGLNINYAPVDEYDFVFSCPPYADLEVYSDLDGDISNMPYDKFMTAYEEIIAKSCKLLKSGGMACFVVGEVRNKQGNYIGFVPDTIKAFEKAGMRYYNEGILLNAMATAAMRAGGNMKSKKLVKVHQNILVFKKP